MKEVTKPITAKTEELEQLRWAVRDTPNYDRWSSFMVSKLLNTIDELQTEVEYLENQLKKTDDKN